MKLKFLSLMSVGLFGSLHAFTGTGEASGYSSPHPAFHRHWVRSEASSHSPGILTLIGNENCGRALNSSSQITLVLPGSEKQVETAGCIYGHTSGPLADGQITVNKGIVKLVSLRGGAPSLNIWWSLKSPIEMKMKVFSDEGQELSDWVTYTTADGRPAVSNLGEDVNPLLVCRVDYAQYRNVDHISSQLRANGNQFIHFDQSGANLWAEYDATSGRTRSSGNGRCEAMVFP